MLAVQVTLEKQTATLSANRMSTVLDEAVLEDRPEVDLSVFASLRAETENKIVLAFDIGTSGVRAGLFNERGDEIPGSQTSLSNQISELANGDDVDAEDLLELVLHGIGLAVDRAENFVSQIDYVAASCFWHSLMGTDDAGRATTPLFGWADTRAANAVAELRTRFSEREVHSRTGARFHPSYWPAKLLWLKQERYDLYRATTCWGSFAEFLYQRLFGSASTAVSMASGTGLLNQRTCEWDVELLTGLDLSIDQLPAITRPGETFRGLLSEFATRWPLLNRAAWFTAIGDGAANNLGAGCVDSTRAALMIGTSGAMRVLSTGAPPAILPPELFCYRADRERIVIGGALSDGGGLYRWMKDTLSWNCNEVELEKMLAEMNPDQHGLTVLPFWSGERAVGWSSSAQGSIVGMTACTKPVDLLRAAMESICYRFALLAHPLDHFAPQARIVAAGNALLSSPAWAQILADVLGRRIEISETVEASTRGAALLALEAAGKIDSIETIESEFAVVYDPDLTRHGVYAGAVERQRRLYEKLIQ